LEIESLPKDIPEKLEVDMSGVELNQMIHVSDLNVDGSVTIVNDSHDVVVNVHLEKVKEEKAEGEEGAEGAEGEAAAAPAEDAGKKEDGKN
jgi:large subunit ribosomal protein L25